MCLRTLARTSRSSSGRSSSNPRKSDSGDSVRSMSVLEEAFDDGHELVALGQHGQVAAVVDVQLGAGDQSRHEVCVDDRDDRVVVAGQDQRGLSKEWQRGEARPAEAGRELVEVAALRAHWTGLVQ